MTGSGSEPLVERVNRAKARWLKRVMYESSATSTQKTFAYAVSDHLYCVTLDCWPALPKLARRLGFLTVKTMHRAARGLELRRFLIIRQVGSLYRFAPVFLPSDEDNIVSDGGQPRPKNPDKNVHESFLSILLESDSSRPADGSHRAGSAQSTSQWKQRGAIEIKVAEWLGPDGMELLSRLAAIDDTIVDRLCKAYAANVLTDRERGAARLAAEQVRL